MIKPIKLVKQKQDKNQPGILIFAKKIQKWLMQLNVWVEVWIY